MKYKTKQYITAAAAAALAVTTEHAANE